MRDAGMIRVRQEEWLKNRERLLAQVAGVLFVFVRKRD